MLQVSGVAKNYMYMEFLIIVVSERHKTCRVGCVKSHETTKQKKSLDPESCNLCRGVGFIRFYAGNV